MDRNREKAELIFQLGCLFGPMMNALKDPDNLTADEWLRLKARFTYDSPKLIEQIRDFSKSEEGHDYSDEFSVARFAISQFSFDINKTDSPQKRLEMVRDSVAVAIGAISSIPSSVTSRTLEENSPFQAYCALKTLFETITKSVVLVDPYVGPSLFIRYFADLDDSVKVTIVTNDRSSHQEFQEFMHLSKLYADERGPQKYRLIFNPSLHDRWLKCDELTYQLGGSMKDAGGRSSFSIQRSGNSKEIDRLIREGNEAFGTSILTHP